MVALKCERKHRLVHGKRLLRTHTKSLTFIGLKKKTSADNKINCPFSTGKFQEENTNQTTSDPKTSKFDRKHFKRY